MVSATVLKSDGSTCSRPQIGAHSISLFIFCAKDSPPPRKPASSAQQKSFGLFKQDRRGGWGDSTAGALWAGRWGRSLIRVRKEGKGRARPARRPLGRLEFRELRGALGSPGAGRGLGWGHPQLRVVVAQGGWGRGAEGPGARRTAAAAKNCGITRTAALGAAAVRGCYRRRSRTRPESNLH